MKKIRVSPLFVAFAAMVIVLGYWYELLIYLICIVMHEMSHAEVARKLGYYLNYIKLMPYGAGLTGEFEGAKWSDEVLIALAGPIFNLLLALFLTAFWWLEPSTYVFTIKIVLASFFTAIFNFLPVYPLDGGRVMLALLSIKLQRQKAYAAMRIIGYCFCLFFLALFILSLIYKANISFALVFLFLLISTILPDKNSKYQRLYSMAFRSEKLKRGMLVRELVISDSATLLYLMRQINSNYFYRFVIVDKNMNSVATISESCLESLLLTHPAETQVCDAIKNNYDAIKNNKDKKDYMK